MLCITNFEIYKILCGRASKSETKHLSSPVLVNDVLNLQVKFFPLRGGSTVSHSQKELRKRLDEMGFTAPESTGIQYMTLDGLSKIDDMVELGLDPRDISREELYEDFRVGYEDRSFDVFAKSTFDALVSRGFAFDEKDLVILDEIKEPALSQIPSLIRGI